MKGSLDPGFLTGLPVGAQELVLSFWVIAVLQLHLSCLWGQWSNFVMGHFVENAFLFFSFLFAQALRMLFS